MLQLSVPGHEHYKCTLFVGLSKFGIWGLFDYVIRNMHFIMQGQLIRISSYFAKPHCNTEQGRAGNKQGNPVIKARLFCNSYRIFPVTGKNSETCRTTLLVPCSTLFGVAVHAFQLCFWFNWTYQEVCQWGNGKLILSKECSGGNLLDSKSRFKIVNLLIWYPFFI